MIQIWNNKPSVKSELKMAVFYQFTKTAHYTEQMMDE